MKRKAFALALVLMAPVAQAQDIWGQMVPIVIGGAAGYKIADHYGGHDGELAAGAVLGSVLASRWSAYRGGSVGYPVNYGCASGYSSGCYNTAPAYGYGYVARGPFYATCSRMVPAEYVRNSGTAQAWVEGCEQRMTAQQAEMEQRAFEEGAR